MNPTLARDGMRYWRLQPDVRLQPWISCYWMVEPDATTRAPAGASAADEHQLLIPDGHSEIVFGLAASFARWRVGAPAARAIMRSSYVIGGRSHSVLTRSIGPLRLAGVKLDPRALRRLIGIPLTELRDVVVSVAELGWRPLLDLEDAVALSRTVGTLARTLDAFFLERLPAADEPAAIRPLVERIRASRGTQSILSWAREHGVDARTLERRFIAAMGMTPKQFARVVRFKHSYHQLCTAGVGGDKPHLDGYYDAAHFNRDFRHFVGTSPLKWLAQSTAFRTTIADHLLAGEFDQGLPA
jgi:AraC-like DNA-binding protein